MPVALSGKEFHKVRDLTTSPRRNLGTHARLNALVDAAANEWVAVLNSDDAFVPGRFEVLRHHLHGKGWELVFGDLAIVDEVGRHLGVKRAVADPEYPFPVEFDVDRMVEEEDWVGFLSNQNVVATTSNMVFRKSLFRRLGGFSPYRYAHDWDFALRASLVGAVGYVPHYLSLYRLHGANTIKEGRDAVVAEVRALFRRLLDDRPDACSSPTFRIGLAANRYLKPRHLRMLTVLLPEAADTGLYEAAIRRQVGSVDVVFEARRIPPDCEYLYAPTSIGEALRPSHLQNLILSLSHQRLDFVLVSHGLQEPPLAGVGALRNQVVFASDEAGVFLAGRSPSRALRGRVARLLPGLAPTVDLADLFVDLYPTVAGPDLTLGPFPAQLGIAESIQPDAGPLFPYEPSTKPLVFVFPALFAVGGVERIMIEVMRQLRPQYDFVVVTTERLGESQGSLHGEADGLVLGCFDLAELAPQSNFLAMIKTLKETYRPSLVWLCNGSPWQCDNAMAIREVFADVPIVDQQAYDATKGWITRYHEPGIRSSDRFVAINKKIENALAQEYGIDPSKIDLIYHPINADRFHGSEVSDRQRLSYARKHGLAGTPDENELFGWIGRLTAQKRPLDFLEFVRRARLHGDRSRFVMVGDGELAAQCDAFIAAHNLTSVRRIRYCAAMWEIYALLSGLIITSEYEGLPVVLLEALAMGVPALSTDVGDIRSILEEYQTGMVVASIDDPAAFEATFNTWKRGLRALRKRAKEAAPEVRGRFSGSAVAARYHASWQAAMAIHR